MKTIRKMAVAVVVLSLAIYDSTAVTNEPPAHAETSHTITVVGRVKKPGILRYTPGMTVTQAIAAAGGLDTSPDGRVGLYRVTGGFAALPAPYHAVPATPRNPNSKDVVMVNILDVMKGKAPDLATQPGDLIFVLELVD